MKPHSPIIKRSGLRDTRQRRVVVDALTELQCGTPRDIETWIHKRHADVNTVTIYRVLDVLEKHKLLHRHSDGRVSLCTMPDTHGHHAMLRCTGCGTVSEFHDESICGAVGKHAETEGFDVSTHVTQILGICSRCR
jgi:Fur family ferric uptake transcriptional regulator